MTLPRVPSNDACMPTGDLLLYTLPSRAFGGLPPVMLHRQPEQFSLLRCDNMLRALAVVYAHVLEDKHVLRERRGC